MCCSSLLCTTSQIFLALSTAAEFRDQLTSFSDYYASLGPPSQDNLPEDGKLKSEMMIKDNRRYYLDLKENPRGRFLRVSQTITRGGPRSQIAIPAQGMIEFRDALTDLVEEFGTDDGGFQVRILSSEHRSGSELTVLSGCVRFLRCIFIRSTATCHAGVPGRVA